MDETGEGEFGAVACRLLLRLDPLFHFHRLWVYPSVNLHLFTGRICGNLMSDVMQHRA
jgi:hypothetical protein